MSYSMDRIEIGDIIEWDSGYTMILPHFGRVDGFTPSGKSVYLTMLDNQIVEDDGYGQSGTVIPGCETGQSQTCRIDPDGNLVYVNHRIAHKWDGQPATFDTYD